MISPEQARAFQLRRQHLERRAPRARMVRVVRDVVGLQSQVASAAAVSLWARVEGITLADVEHAVERSRKLARTWSLRGTVHLHAREDVAPVTTALGFDVSGLRLYMMRRGLLNERLYGNLRAAILDALAEGPRTRAELEAFVAPRIPGSAKFFGSWGGVMRILAHEGITVFGPRRGAETTFVRSDFWWPAWKGVPVSGPASVSPSATPTRPPACTPAPACERARADLLRRYLRVYAPAALTDLAYWTGLPAGTFREAMGSIAEELVEGTLEGRSVWLLRSDAPALRRCGPPEGVRLLPHFDTSLLAHRGKDLFMEAKHYKKVYRAGGWIAPTILIDGRVAGTWSYDRSRTTLRVTFEPFGSLPRGARSALRKEADSLARFLGLAGASVHG